MPRVRPMLAISIGFTMSAAVTFALAAELTAAHRTFLFMSLDRDVAVASLVIAALCWLELRRDARQERRDGERAGVHDECRRREEVMILALNSQVEAPTGPLQRLHAV
jgi:hypothetical protein